MQRKRIIYIQEGMQAYGRLSKLAGELDCDFNVTSMSNASVAASQADLVICCVAEGQSESLARLEQRLRDSDGIALLLLVEAEGLKTLRLPSHINVDFALAQAPDAELLIRMRHLLWPDAETANSDFIKVDSMIMNLSTYQVLVNGKPIDFTYLEYALLAFLVTHASHVYSRDALLSRVWGFDYFGGSRTVDVHVRRVRSKLGNDLASHLKTVRGVGYMWE